MSPYDTSLNAELDDPGGALFLVSDYQKKIIRHLVTTAEARGARRITDAINSLPQCCEDQGCHVPDVWEAADKVLHEIVLNQTP